MNIWVHMFLDEEKYAVDVRRILFETSNATFSVTVKFKIHAKVSLLKECNIYYFFKIYGIIMGKYPLMEKNWVLFTWFVKIAKKLMIDYLLKCSHKYNFIWSSAKSWGGYYFIVIILLMKIQRQTDWMTYPSWYKLFNTQIRAQNLGVTASNSMGFPPNETAFQLTEQMQKFLLRKKHIF